MKKVSLIIMILLAVSFVPLNFAFSQGEKTAKGRIELGGNVGFTHESYKYKSESAGSWTDLTVMPRVGYFVIPKLAVEPTLLISHTSWGDGTSYSVTNFGALLNVAYHFEGKSEAKFVPFVFGGAGFLSHSGDVGETNGEKNDKMSLIAPHAGGGIKFFFTNTALIRAELFYEHVTNEDGVKDYKADEFGLTAGVSIFVK
jgi:hypothetical protein